MEGEEEEEDIDGDDPLVENGDNDDEVPPSDPHDDASSPLAVADTHEGDSVEAVEVCMAEPVMVYPDNQLGLADSPGDDTLFYEPHEPNETVSTTPSGSDASGGNLQRATPLDLNTIDLSDTDGEMGGACLNPSVHINSTPSPIIQRWCVPTRCAILFLWRW
jgi:hypothetical protein